MTNNSRISTESSDSLLGASASGNAQADAMHAGNPPASPHNPIEPFSGSAWRALYGIRWLLDRLVVGIAATLFCCGVVATFISALARSFPRFLPNVPWALEFTKFSIIAAVFLILAIGLRQGNHLAVTPLLDHAPAPIFRVLTAVNQLLMMSFFVLLTIYGYEYAMLNRAQQSPLLHLSLMYPYLMIVLSGAMMCVESFVRFLEAAAGVAPRPSQLTRAQPDGVTLPERR